MAPNASHVATEAHGWLTTRTALLVCGILASLVYVVANVVAGLSWDGYSFTNQTISELSAIDAPSRSIWFAFMIPYGLLSLAFVVGLWSSGRGDRGLRIAAILLLVLCVLGPFWPSMHLRGTPATMTDTMHLVFAGIASVIFLLAVGFAADSFGAWFRFYSMATLAALVLFGFATFWMAPALGRNEPTPWLGVYERMDVGAYMVWVAVLAVMAIRRSSYSARS